MNPVRPVEIPALTGLRGIAAFTVFVAHFDFSAFVPSLKWITPMFLWHNQAVDLFFILSGFILNHVYAASLRNRVVSWREYLWARIARIFPLHLVLLGLNMVMIAAWAMLRAKPLRFDPRAMAWNIPLLQNWPGIYVESYVLPAWSLSVEWLCYLTVFPLVSLLLMKGAAKSKLWLALAVLVAARMMTPLETQNWPAIARGVLGFLIGWLLHRIFLRNSVSSKCGGRWLTLSSLAFAVTLIGSALQFWSAECLNLVFPLLIFCLVAAPSSAFVMRLLNLPVVMWLGSISYSLYLWHPMVAMPSLYVVRPYLAGTSVLVRISYVLVEVAAVLLVSTISYRAIEKPARRRLNRLFKHRVVAQ